MNDSVLWRVHIYQMTNAATLEAIADLLGRVHDLTAETTGPLHCLTVTCRDSDQARDVHRLVTLSDPKAVLVNTTYGLSKPLALGPALGSP
jgi:hypothetical protein